MAKITEEQFAKIVLTLKSAYNISGFLETPAQIMVWYKALDDIDYETLMSVVFAYISSEEKIPTVGGIRKKLKEIVPSDSPNEIVAWGMVRKALNNGYYHSVEEFEKLPPLVQKAVGSPQMLQNWATSDIKSIETVIQSNFIKTYRGIVERSEKVDLIPTKITDKLTELMQTAKMGEIEDKKR